MIEHGIDEFLRETIISAGVLLRSLGPDAHSNAETREADQQMSHFILETISERYPQHHHVSEEARGREIEASALTWIIDPIDGSDNFYRGIPCYSISISLVRGNDILLGAVYESYLDRLFFASRGGGATVNGKSLRVSTIADTRRAVVAISKASSFARTAEGPSAFCRIAGAVEIRISSSTALDMCHVASGALEGRVLADTRVWDNSAAALIVREAGGVVTDWDGNAPSLTSRRLLASNGFCHDALLSLLRSSAVPPSHD